MCFWDFFAKLYRYAITPSVFITFHFVTPLPIIFHQRLTCECNIDACVFNIRSDTLAVNICWSEKKSIIGTVPQSNWKIVDTEWRKNWSPSGESAFTPSCCSIFRSLCRVLWIVCLFTLFHLAIVSYVPLFDVFFLSLWYLQTWGTVVVVIAW
jgi:hypothetical protein